MFGCNKITYCILSLQQEKVPTHLHFNFISWGQLLHAIFSYFLPLKCQKMHKLRNKNALEMSKINQSVIVSKLKSKGCPTIWLKTENTLKEKKCHLLFQQWIFTSIVVQIWILPIFNKRHNLKLFKMINYRMNCMGTSYNGNQIFVQTRILSETK